MSLSHMESLVAAATSVLPYIAGGVVAAVALAPLSKAFSWSSKQGSGVPLPPGPPARWFWESPLPEQDTARTLTSLIDRYGPVISLRRGNHVTVVIGSVDAAAEIMEKEGGALVDRPQQIAAAELISHGMRLLLQPAGDRLRRLRRAVHIPLQPKAATSYERLQTEAAKSAILDVLNDPKQHMEHARRYASSVIIRVTYGKTSPTSNDDPEIVRLRQVTKNFQSALRPGAYLVDFIPWLKYLPGYDKQLQSFHEYELALFRDQLDRVRNDMAAGSAGPSFGKTLLEHTGDNQLSDDEMAYLAGALFVAGSDTTAAGITIMIMAAVCNPEAQTRVQEELNEVVGNDRVPTFMDWDMLPQLQAFILEALRWRPVTHLGFAHRAMKDIIWRGQRIPAGATVIGCHWAITRDPVVFPDPETFNPGRWLTEDGRVRKDMHSYTFGFGRRVCPGQYVANRSLFINIALLLWSFRILQRPDAPIVHDASGFRNPVVFRPNSFEVDFVPRVEERRLRELMAESATGEVGI